MRLKTQLLFFLLLFMALGARAAVFVVTSNADSGPGTLRDALTQAAANDSTQTDYITFNLLDVSEAGRTITLQSQLPDVSSNLIIDASTQPGTKFGVSDARILLQYNTPVLRSLSGLRIMNKHDVSVYGLYIVLLTKVSSPSNAYPFLYSGMELKNSKNIQIGAAGKGNVVNGFYFSLSVNPTDTVHHQVSSFFFENVILKDNIFGVAADGETQSINQTVPVVIEFIVGEVDLGGTVAEGNLFAQGLQIDQINSYNSTNPVDYYVSTPAVFNIKNNKIGVDYAVKQTLATSDGLHLSTVDPNGKNTYHIEDNVIDGPSNSIFIGNNGAPIYILRNYTGTDKSFQNVLKTSGIFIYGATSVQIGSSNAADANYMTNCKPVQVWPFSNVTYNKNSFYCTVNAYPVHTLSDDFPYPIVDILAVTSNSVNGTATPNAAIELFYSDICGTCSPQTYFASTTADNAGNWRYDGPVTGSVIASATLNNNTSEFTRTSIDVTNVMIINTCLANGLGSIKGLVPKSAANIKWLDINGKVVGTSPDLLNVPLGKYKLLAQSGGCSDSTAYFEIKNKFQVDTGNMKKIEPTCGNVMGNISGINIINNDLRFPSVKWADASGKVLSNLLTLSNVPAGSYYLNITSADSTCTQQYGPIVLTNTTGPNIDQTKMVVKPTNCGQTIGAITGIVATGTGPLVYSWKNAQQQQVGTTADLTGQPAGQYILQVTDNTQCGPVYTAAIQIPETNGIMLDESQVKTSITGCNNISITITGIQVTGATLFQWMDGNKKVVANTADLLAAGAGDYTLTASNAYGCSKSSKTYHFGVVPPTAYPLYNATIQNACFGQSNGSVSVVTDTLAKLARWANSQGQTLATGNQLNNLAAGVYQLYLTNQTGCEAFYSNYTIAAMPQLQLIAGSGQIINDQCTLKTGSINGILVSGGFAPYTYRWTDGSGKTISSSADIGALGTGDYTLQVNDSRNCGVVSGTYHVQDEENVISSPLVNNVRICSPGNVLVTVNNPQSSNSYHLYASSTSTAPLDTRATGIFTVNARANMVVYVSQFSGTCESGRTAVQVSVGISASDIPNAFTPNNDGVNDYWNIPGIDNYPAALIQIFNRYGQKVFDSKGYAQPFDGSMNGQRLPAGTYYYIINLSSTCSLLSGSVTLVR